VIDDVIYGNHVACSIVETIGSSRAAMRCFDEFRISRVQRGYFGERDAWIDAQRTNAVADTLVGTEK
jgi:hypothetical protein